MIHVTVYDNEDGQYMGFVFRGHAGYGEEGQDIVCAGVSALLINAVNSIESLAGDSFRYKEHEGEDVVTFFLTSRPVSEKAALLLKSLVLGLQGIEHDYGKQYLKLEIKRKQEV